MILHYETFFIIQNNLYQYNSILHMKRPQSAKPGYRAPVLQNSTDDIKEQDIAYKNVHRKQVKLLKPDLTTNDFARIMPKKIYQDKERLYSEGLQLKQKLNELQEENIRLKTRISILEKQKDKLSKAIDTAAETGNKSQSRFKVHQGPTSDKESAMLLNMKKIIRESKQQNQYLRQQNAKIKKAVKFTKINEVEIECKILREEYQKLEELLVEMNGKLHDQEQYEKQIGELKGYLEQQVQANKQLSQSNQKYAEYIEELQEKLKAQTEKVAEKEKKLQRQIAFQKRKLNEEIKVSDDLRRQIKALKQAPQNADMKRKAVQIKNAGRPMTSIPINKQQNKQQPSPVTSNQAAKKMDQMKKQNEKLQRQLKEMRQKFQQLGKQNQELVAKKQKQQEKEKEKTPQKKKPQVSNNNEENKSLGVDSEHNDEYEDEKFEEEGFIMSAKKQRKESPSQSPPKKKNKEQKQQGEGLILKQSKKEDAYDGNFDELEQQKQAAEARGKGPASKKAIDTNVQKYNKDLEEDDADEEQLYKKQPKKQQKQNSKKKKTDRGYLPNKEILNQIKQLLTYRLKAQRYPYDQIEKDLLATNETKFVYSDLQSMLKTQPFYLTPAYAKAFLEYVFEKKVVKPKESISTETLLKKLRKVIKDFQLVDEKQEEERLMSIAEMTSQYPEELENAFQKIKNGPQTVAKKDLVEMFKKLQLADHFIQIIIAELSLCSEDLDHLSIRGYFEKFYIQDMDSQDNAIDEQQIESSGQMQPKGKSKIQKIDEEDQYDDDKVNFIMNDEASLSMRGKGGRNITQNDDIVSDDGHI